MSMFNQKQIDAMFGDDYICSQCGAKMEFEDEWRDNLICPKYGYEVDIDRYGFESEEEYDALFPTKEELLGIEEERDEYDDEDYCGETYDEVCGELSDD